MKSMARRGPASRDQAVFGSAFFTFSTTISQSNAPSITPE
jgi:hypothetical protein